MLCQLSHSIQRDEKGGRDGTELKSTNEVNKTLVCSEGLMSDLIGGCECEFGGEFYKTTTKLYTKKKTWKYDDSSPIYLMSMST